MPNELTRGTGKFNAKTAVGHSCPTAASLNSFQISVCDAYSILHSKGHARRSYSVGSTRRSHCVVGGESSRSDSPIPVSRHHPWPTRTRHRLDWSLRSRPIAPAVLIDSFGQSYWSDPSRRSVPDSNSIAWAVRLRLRH